MDALPSYERFREEIGTTFTVAAVADPDSEEVHEVDLRLHAVSERIVSPRGEEWALEFRGPLAWAFEQGIASLDHGRFGRIDLFLVPIGPAGDEMCYQAAFSLLVAVPA